MKKIGIFIIAVIAFVYTNCCKVSAAETVSSSNEVKVFIGIAVLCVVTFLVILRRVMHEKRNN